MKKTSTIIGLILLFVFSFLFFLWATFPYEVLKESLSNQLSEALGQNIRIGELGPKFPLGVKFAKVSVAQNSSSSISVKEVSVSASPLSLLIGRISVSLEIYPTEGEPLEINSGMGLFSVLTGNITLPKTIEINSKGFPVGPFIDHALAVQADSPTANPLVAPLLKQIHFDGKLVADVDLAMNASDPANSSGKFSLAFKDAALTINGASLNIPNQSFETAKVEAQLDKAVFAIKEGSGLKSSDLTTEISGNITLKQPTDKSSIAASIQVELRGPLKDSFGFIMDAASGSQTDGKLAMKIEGTLGTPSVTTR
jgi:type II secretion system protein N